MKNLKSCDETSCRMNGGDAPSFQKNDDGDDALNRRMNNGDDALTHQTNDGGAILPMNGAHDCMTHYLPFSDNPQDALLCN